MNKTLQKFFVFNISQGDKDHLMNYFLKSPKIHLSQLFQNGSNISTFSVYLKNCAFSEKYLKQKVFYIKLLYLVQFVYLTFFWISHESRDRLHQRWAKFWSTAAKTIVNFLLQKNFFSSMKVKAPLFWCPLMCSER